MSSVILDGLENENYIQNALKDYYCEKGGEFSYFKLKDMNILPCRSCGACGFKSPGKCIICDDMHDVMRAIAKSSIYIVLTPVRFGGYSSHLKKAIDRTMPIGMPLYTVKDGHLLHQMRYGDKALIGIGLTEQNIQGQEQNFGLLIANNALNMGFSYNKALIFKPSDSVSRVKSEIGSLIGNILHKSA